MFLAHLLGFDAAVTLREWHLRGLKACNFGRFHGGRLED